MQIIDYSIFEKNMDHFVLEAFSKKIFVYPTDTIYGIWGVFPNTLEKVYEIKKRSYNKPVSIIAPSWDWIENTLELPEDDFIKLKNIVFNLRKKWRGFTVIAKMNPLYFNNLPQFAKYIYSDYNIWIRLLNHPFQKFVSKLSKPFITTSANISWNPNIKEISELEDDIKNKIDYIIDYWILSNSPSVLINYSWHWKFDLIYR